MEDQDTGHAQGRQVEIKKEEEEVDLQVTIGITEDITEVGPVKEEGQEAEVYLLLKDTGEEMNDPASPLYPM